MKSYLTFWAFNKATLRHLFVNVCKDGNKFSRRTQRWKKVNFRDVNKAGSLKAKAKAKSLKAKAKSLKAKAKARSLKAKTKAKARDQGMRRLITE